MIDAVERGAHLEGARGGPRPTERLRRIACVDLPQLPLQVLRRDHPTWEGLPVAVVARDEPHAPVTWVSAAAQQLGVRVGMRYVAALAISRELRAAPVPAQRVEDLRAELVGALHRFTPRVEPDRTRVGVVWLDPEGMLSLFGSLDRWARAVAGELEARRWVGSVVVGFARLPAWAIARGSGGSSGAAARVLTTPEQERELAARVPLACLDLPVELADGLFVMGVRTLGELLAIPRSELSVRFGRDAARLHAELEGSRELPFEAAHAEAPIEIEAEVDPPEDDEARLLFCMRGALHVLVGTLTERRLALAALHVELESERGLGLVPGQVHREVLRPARASRDVASVTELLRLRLAALAADGRLGTPLERGPRGRTAERVGRIARIRLRAEPAPPDAAQLALTGADPEARRGRDPDALARGIARLRAAFGDDAVTVPRLEDSWVPERSFRWEPVERMPERRVRPPRPSTALPRPPPQPSPASGRGSSDMNEGHDALDFWAPSLVRRILAPPLPLEASPGGGPRVDPPLRRMNGPFRLQSAWWAGAGTGTGTGTGAGAGTGTGMGAGAGAGAGTGTGTGAGAGAITRDYFYAERVDGALLWLYRDVLRERWYLQGIVD